MTAAAVCVCVQNLAGNLLAQLPLAPLAAPRLRTLHLGANRIHVVSPLVARAHAYVLLASPSLRAHSLSLHATVKPSSDALHELLVRTDSALARIRIPSACRELGHTAERQEEPRTCLPNSSS